MVSPTESRRAVVIEDDPDIRGLLVRVLVKQGFDVTQAGTGLTGVEEVRRKWQTDQHKRKDIGDPQV